MSRESGPLSERQTHDALCNRVQVMGNHGCLPELLDDIGLLAAACPMGQPFPAAWRAAVARAIQLGWVYSVARDDWPGFVAAARRLAGRGGQGAPVRALAAGVGAMARGYPGTPGERLRRARDAGQLWWASWRPALAPAAAPRA